MLKVSAVAEIGGKKGFIFLAKFIDTQVRDEEEGPSACVGLGNATAPGTLGPRGAVTVEGCWHTSLPAYRWWRLEGLSAGAGELGSRGQGSGGLLQDSWARAWPRRLLGPCHPVDTPCAAGKFICTGPRGEALGSQA